MKRNPSSPSGPAATLASAAGARAAAKRELAALRDAVCVGPRHPGRPEDYRLTLRASCTPADASDAAGARMQRKRRQATSRSGVPGAVQTRAEVARLEREMRDVYPDRDAVYDTQFRDGKMQPLAFLLFRLLIDPGRRLRIPDPVQRYNAIVAEEFSRARYKAGFPVGDLPRHMILNVTLEHLRAILPQPFEKNKGVATVRGPSGGPLGRPGNAGGTTAVRRKTR